MPVESRREGDNVIYTFSGLIDVATVHDYLNFNFADYDESGDALGAILDIRQMSRPTISGLRVAQNRLKGVIFDTPVAFIGSPDSLATTFLKGVEAITSRGRSRFHFCNSVAEAVTWIEAWYIAAGKDRQALRGHQSAQIPPEIVHGP